MRLSADERFRVLIVRIGAMGDVLHSMPAVAALRKLHPEWEVRWAIEPRWSELLVARGFEQSSGRGLLMPMVDGWYAVPTKEWKRRALAPETFREIGALRKELRAERFGRFDLCVDMQWAIRSAVVGRMAGAKRFVGVEVPREGLAKWLYPERVRVLGVHVVEQACSQLGAAVGESLRPAKVSFPVDPAAEAWCDRMVGSEVVRDSKFVVIAPAAGWGAKEWPAERYGAVAARLVRAGFAVLVNAIGAGDKAAQAVVRASESGAVAVPCSVGQMIALMRRASLAIGGDTGPVHLAVALERPVVAIYGPTDPARNGPFWSGMAAKGRVLRDAASVTDHAKVAEVEAGLLRIGVDEVAEAALEVLGESLIGQERSKRKKRQSRSFDFAQDDKSFPGYGVEMKVVVSTGSED